MRLNVRLRQLLDERRISQHDFAAGIQMSDSQVCLLLSGKRNPSFGTLQHIADELNLTLSELLKEVDG